MKNSRLLVRCCSLMPAGATVYAAAKSFYYKRRLVMFYRPLLLADLVLLLIIASQTASAKIRMPEIFTDHMVLQQDQPIAVWGWAEPGEQITVVVNATTLKAEAGTDGSWSIASPAIKFAQTQGKAVRFEVRGAGEKLEYKDVVIGEVWLASGQSNMNRPVDAATIKAAALPNIRMFTSNGSIPRRNSLNDTVGWVACTPETIAVCGDDLGNNRRRPFSEVAYHFARKIHLELKVPVGIIHTSMGGTTARDWTPNPDIASQYPFDKECGGDARHKWGIVYQARLPGMVPFAIKGVVWYQGEDDGGNKGYGNDMKALIESWRQLWKQPEMPFYFIQPAQTSYHGGMLDVWAGQVWTMNHVTNTGLIPSNDIYDNGPGNFKPGKTDNRTGWPITGGRDPHPPFKPLVAVRLADAVLGKVYGRNASEVFGPMYEGHQISGNRVIVKFKHVGTGLSTNDGKEPNWFEISADGQNYVKAEGKITAVDTITVSAGDVPRPQFVRFGWDPLARHNLINRNGLPAVSFLTPARPTELPCSHPRRRCRRQEGPRSR